MLVKTSRRGGSQRWFTQLNPTMSASMRNYDEYPGDMEESTVTVYYNCDRDRVTVPRDCHAMKGARRVVTFFLLAFCIPVMLLIFPLYLKHSTYGEMHYSLMQYDVIPLTEGLSSFFCQRHIVRSSEGMFSAYSLKEAPKSGHDWKFKVNESTMAIPDDKLEYWGFVLLPGSIINLSVCAKNPGANLLVVRGERNLELCGLLQHSIPSKPVQLPTDNESVFIVQRPESSTTPEAIITPSALEAELEEENVGGEVTDPPGSDVTMAPNLVRHLRSKLRHQRDVATTFPPTNDNMKKVQVPSEIKHGGNTVNFLGETENEDGSSISSFETDLLNCFYGKVLFQGVLVAGGKLCDNVSYSNWHGILHLTQTIHSQDHFYYVFYSDNDVDNSTVINARFEINSTKYDFSNATSSCMNSTKCYFNKTMTGGDGIVYVEAVSDVLLISACEPRGFIYLLFPVTALLMVLIFGLL